MVSEQMFNDITELERPKLTGCWTPVTNQPWFAFPGVEGFTSDAVTRVLKDPKTGLVSVAEGGWEVHLFGLITGAA